MGVSKNRGTPKSSILIGFLGFSIINHPFWGTPIFGNTHMVLCTSKWNVFEDEIIWVDFFFIRSVFGATNESPDFVSLNGSPKIKGQLGVPLTVYPWYL